jgi:hypothetical protein
LFQKLKKPTFVAPSPQVQKQLRIPFLENGAYGLCDYEGKMLLKPQFEDIEMPAFDLPFVKAKKNGEWSLYDLSGKQMLPFSVKTPHLLNVELDYKTFEGNDYHYVAKVRDPETAYLKPMPREDTGADSSGGIEAEVKPESAPRFYYFTKNTKPPLQSWFAPNDRVYYDFSKKTGYHNQAFSSGVFRGFWKVMDEKRRFTLLDENTVPLFPPVFNCAAISPTKILILKENGLCALRDVKKGWQTDFLFRNVEVTKNPDMCLGEAKVEGKVVKYKIDAHGKITPLEHEYAWLALNERYSCIGEKTGEYQLDFYLFDEKTNQKVRKLPHRKIEKIFEEGFGIYNENQLLGIETVAGDTIWKPSFPRIEGIGDSLYLFYSGDTSGLATRSNRVMYRVEKGEIMSWGDGWFQVKKDGKFGLIASDGRGILPVEFDQIHPMRAAGRLIARKNGLWGMFDRETGAEILPVQFKHLKPNGYPFWYGGGVEIRSGADFFILSPNLEVVHQNTQNPILTKKDFPLKNTSEAAKADFEKAEMPRFFTPFCVFKGANWLHIFRCDGTHTASLEGFKEFEMEYSSSTESNEEIGNARFTGVARLTSDAGKRVWVRLADGVLYQK